MLCGVRMHHAYLWIVARNMTRLGITIEMLIPGKKISKKNSDAMIYLLWCLTNQSISLWLLPFFVFFLFSPFTLFLSLGYKRDIYNRRTFLMCHIFSSGLFISPADSGMTSYANKKCVSIMMWEMHPVYRGPLRLKTIPFTASRHGGGQQWTRCDRLCIFRGYIASMTTNRISFYSLIHTPDTRVPVYFMSGMYFLRVDSWKPGNRLLNLSSLLVLESVLFKKNNNYVLYHEWLSVYLLSVFVSAQ